MEINQRHAKYTAPAAAIFMSIAALTLLISEWSREGRYEGAPTFGHYMPYQVSFHDNNAVGMKASIEFNQEKREMIPVETEANYASFHVPKEAWVAGKFKIKATDRDEKESRITTLVDQDNNGIFVNEKDI